MLRMFFISASERGVLSHYHTLDILYYDRMWRCSCYAPGLCFGSGRLLWQMFLGLSLCAYLLWEDSTSMSFLGAFAKFRKATLSSSPSVRMERLSSHRTDCLKICLRIFRKSVEKTPVPLKSDENIRYLIWLLMCIYDSVSLNSSYNDRFFRTKIVEEIKTYYN
jgi:hypothetical protein